MSSHVATARACLFSVVIYKSACRLLHKAGNLSRLRVAKLPSHARNMVRPCKVKDIS